MNGLEGLALKTAYRKGQDDIAMDFYLPCMAIADRYDRAVGYFNSAIYVIAWPSLKDFVSRKSKMRLVCSPILQPKDIEAIENGYSERFEAENSERLRDQIGQMLATPSLYKPVSVLAALVALGIVDIKIAFVKPATGHDRLFHDKLGIFHDTFAHAISFKGSMNETWSGLSADGNLESVDVFLSWEHEREAERVKENEVYFEALWNNTCEGVTVKAFPDLARAELVNAADIRRWPDLVDEICHEIEAAGKFENTTIDAVRKLRPHQTEALKGWEEQGRRGIFEHATGSGKTFTALAAMRESLARREVPLVLVPSELLLKQWYEEIVEGLADLQPDILRCGAGHVLWRTDELIAPWTRSTSERHRIVLSTMQTAVSSEFRESIQQGSHVFLVADEVHRIGSQKNINLLSLDTGPRLGLSATPHRAGDPEGTEKILQYFNDIIQPPFALKDAINSGVLTPYFYHVHTVTLEDSEQLRWDELTAKIRRISARNSSGDEPSTNVESQIKWMLIERARILKQARGKAPEAANIIRQHYDPGDRWIVYCDDQAQLFDVQSALSVYGLDSMEYHSTMKGDKDRTIRLFEANGGIVVSIRCLDEGVDIPSVTHALILASSKNPREYIQRRGRVLRRSDGKAVAHIHDLLVLPTTVFNEKDKDDPRLNILGGEIVRSHEFGKSALNPAARTDLERIALQFSADYKELLGVGFEDEE